MNWITKILEKIACRHKWDIHHTVNVWGDPKHDTYPNLTKQTLICNKCGAIKKITL